MVAQKLYANIQVGTEKGQDMERQGARIPKAVLAVTGAVIGLMMTPTPARAEAVTLVCQAELGLSFTLRVDYDRKIVDLLRSDGTAQYSAAATITEGAVEWNTVIVNSGGYVFRGSLNRLSGQGWEQHPEVWNDGRSRAASQILFGPCRRATQKF